MGVEPGQNQGRGANVGGRAAGSPEARGRDAGDERASPSMPPPRPNGPSRLPPLTGVLQTDPAGGLVVRRVRVRVVAGADRGREAMLEAGTLLVGTHSENDLILRDTTVAKYHLELSLVASGVRVRDLGGDGSGTGGPAMIPASTVPPATELTIGKTTLALIPADQTVPLLASERTAFGPVLGRAPAVRELFALLERLAPSEVPVLIDGESGAGRTLVAKAMHAASRFAATPITVIDLAAPAHSRPALRQIAHRSDAFTLLLENIDEAPTVLWPELLALYERREEGVLDARIIATAKEGLAPRPTDPRTRRELLSHVTAVRLRVPPLRARMQDVPLLLRQFAKEACGVEPPFVDEDFARALARSYPGNVRDLKQLVVRALAEEKPSRVQLPAEGIARARAALVVPLNARPKPPDPTVARERICDELLRDDLMRARAEHGDDHGEIARVLGVTKVDVLRCFKRWGLIEAPQSEAPPAPTQSLPPAPAAKVRSARPEAVVSEPARRRSDRSGTVKIPPAAVAEAAKKPAKRVAK